MEFRRISDIPPTVCGLIFTYSSICALKIKHYYWEWFNFWSYRNVESGRCTKNQVLRNGIELLRQVHALPDQFGTRKRFCLWIPWKSVISRFLRENLHLKRPLFQEDLGYFCNSFVLAFLDVPSFMRLQQATKSSCSVRDVLSKLEKTVVHSA